MFFQPVSREQQNGPGFHYIVRWRRQQQQIVHDQPQLAPANTSVTSRHDEFEERRVASNMTELLLGGLAVFSAYDVYVMSVNDIGPAVTAPHLVNAYTGEDGVYCQDTSAVVEYEK